MRMCVLILKVVSYLTVVSSDEILQTKENFTLGEWDDFKWTQIECEL